MTIPIPPDVRGLIFDCDGTLADTMPLHYRAWNDAFSKYGHVFPEELFYAMAGIPTLKITEILNQHHGYKLPVPHAADEKEMLFTQLISQVTPIPPVVDVARQHARRLPMAVATGGTLDIVAKTLLALDLGEMFDAIVTADDVQHGKPAPDIFLESARRIGVDPSLCLVFEDAELGIQGAVAAGMRVIDIRPFHQHYKARAG